MISKIKKTKKIRKLSKKKGGEDYRYANKDYEPTRIRGTITVDNISDYDVEWLKQRILDKVFSEYKDLKLINNRGKEIINLEKDITQLFYYKINSNNTEKSHVS